VDVTPKEEYSRADVRRKFGLSERQLKGWERQRLIPEAAAFEGMVERLSLTEAPGILEERMREAGFA